MQQHWFGFVGGVQAAIKSNNSGIFSPVRAETLKFGWWDQINMIFIVCITHLRKSSKPSSLLAFSKPSEVIPSSPLSSRSHLLRTTTQITQSLGPDNPQTPPDNPQTNPRHPSVNRSDTPATHISQDKWSLGPLQITSSDTSLGKISTCSW